MQYGKLSFALLICLPNPFSMDKAPTSRILGQVWVYNILNRQRQIGDIFPLWQFSSGMGTERGLPWSPKHIRSSRFVKCLKKKDANDPVTSRTTSKSTCSLGCPTHGMEIQKDNNNSGKALKEGRFKKQQKQKHRMPVFKLEFHNLPGTELLLLLLF